MPIYMDVHIIPGVKAQDVAEAHRKDLLLQDEHGCKCMTYWIDEERENIFCLIDAPTKEAVEEMHGRAHGLIPNKIIEVSNGLVESFLGRIYDPSSATVTDDGLKVFEDPSFRILLLTTLTDPVLLRHNMGKEKAAELLGLHNRVIRKNLLTHGGREVEHEGNGFLVSFTSALKAVSCALDIQKELDASNVKALGLRMAINAGEPVEKSNELFGDTIHLATQLVTISKDGQVAMSASVRELVLKDHFQIQKNHFFVLSPQDEQLLGLLFAGLEEHWQDADFDMDEFCRTVAMSKSQLYRKAISLTGQSPNSLLKEFRLEKAKFLLKKRHYNIAQITFETGFTSASYFTKCFKKKYGLLPMAYLDLLHE